MAAEHTSDDSTERRDYTAIIILGTLGLLEVGILYVLIAVETPVTPLVHRLLEKPPGVFVVVMFVVTSLCFGMAGLLACAEWLHRRRAAGGVPRAASAAPEERH
ncbi:MAG TPA: hypothetical protein VNA89_04820 [Gemmatimonadaceae bacterium]|nr:hypothetical protein [Gemmatimonadaceae bacterium]